LSGGSRVDARASASPVRDPRIDVVAPESPVRAAIVPRLPHVSAPPTPDTFGAADPSGVSPPSSSPPPQSPGRHFADYRAEP